MIRNLKIISVFIIALFITLAVRLAYIQIAGHNELAAATRAQSLISLEGSNTRGIIYDRSGKALVANDKHYIYIIKDEDFNNGAAQLLSSVDASPVSSDNEGYHVYSSQDYDKDAGRELIKKNHAYILQAAARYSECQPAAHLIGYVNKQDSSGAAGLELMYDEQLSGFNRRVYAVCDVEGNILTGRGLLIVSDASQDSYVAEGIRTTIDKNLQEEVEKIINDNEENSCVVVLDSNTGGVAAMACTPGFDPNDVGRYIRSGGNELMNKATQGEYPPGSIFKIVVAAAALESGIDEDKTYTCSGNVQLEDMTIGCETGGENGHGEISFKNAFAKSCNSFFIQLGQETGADAIVEMAENMGLGKKALDDYPQESAGHMMTAQERAGDAIGNLSIGQGETLVTPVQVAAMTNIIANGGVDRGVHLLMNEESTQQQVISESTAHALSEMMELTVKEGTGNIIGMDEEGNPKAAAKTGTAEYGDEEAGGTHAWITGFTPCDEPEYVITVLVEGGASGSMSAGPIMRDIIEYLEESGSYSRPTLA